MGWVHAECSAGAVKGRGLGGGGDLSGRKVGQSIDMSRGIVESEKGEVYGKHSLEREEGPALALVAALLE
ncbi:hypothetical protein NDU88_006264 [Pleurodeles waltl]|uniref:Uncharacterized protein n=1 Tax=Pleurodeles waltl TaxID=8319 RepID=A0AAV7N0S1_PLEWA|nr:hypothetical protein NDU88_006264 [Pleurodeles waltl]